ncbi:hypothetical protein KIL84_014822 [Mauremys mutica]|uniref:Uncharacterized protein n=1 Tax=Mauremys mutica TaxID=74926 RepID=A0A9D3XRF4_9SAUR|nr:hypothetical protein KIL84_014822 [Mauremys mutica]
MDPQRGALNAISLQSTWRYQLQTHRRNWNWVVLGYVNKSLVNKGGLGKSLCSHYRLSCPQKSLLRSETWQRKQPSAGKKEIDWTNSWAGATLGRLGAVELLPMKWL